MTPFQNALAAAAVWSFSVTTTTLDAQSVAPPPPPPPAPVAVVSPPAAVVAPIPPSAPPPDAPGPPYEPKPSEYNPSPLVRIDVLMVSVPEEKALPLLKQLRDSAQIDAAQATLLEMIARKEANLEGWPEVTTHSQVRAVSESIVEQRYPIEFEGPACAACLATARLPASDRTKFASSPAERLEKAFTQIGGNIPTTFETRNTGATLEVDPVVSPDGTAVTLSLAPQLVRFERYADFPAGTTDKGEKLTVSQPIFTTSKVSTTLSLRDGERRLIHVGKATEDHSRVDLFILGATIIPSPK